MKLNKILERVDNDFDEQFVSDYHLRDVWDATNIKQFIHAQIKQAVLDVLPEEKEVKTPANFYARAFNECRQEILNKLKE